MDQIEEEVLDLKLLQKIQPPSTYPPTQSELILSLQNKFYEQCYRFVEAERKFYSCSKKVQLKLESSLSGAKEVIEEMTTKAKLLDKIQRDLKKIKSTQIQLDEHEEYLKKLCDLVNIPDVKEVLLREGGFDEEEYLSALDKVDNLVVELKEWNTQAPIIVQIREEFSTILEDSINKVIKNSNQMSLIHKIIKQHSKPFLRDEKVTAAFTDSLKNNRINHFRVALNPLVNNINYANNVVQIYESIVEQWLEILDEEVKIFMREGIDEKISSVLRQTMEIVVGEIMPKLQRNAYKVKDIVGIAKIRYALNKLKLNLLKYWDNDWDPLPKILVKTHIFLQQGLEEEAKSLSTRQYNIYSLSEYLPIREHLESIKICKEYDTKTIQLDWEKAFKTLANSRSPTQQPKNKSLLIFNLNIWYLYLKVMKEGQLRQKGEKVVNWCLQTFININFNGVKETYKGDFSKLIDICSDVNGVKKLIEAQLALIGHENLRKTIFDTVKEKFMKEVYSPMLEQNNITKTIGTDEIIRICKEKKVNIEKYSKITSNIHIFDAQTLDQYLT